MIINIPEELYTMKAKRSIIKLNAKAYKKASRKEKKEILDDLQKTLHLHRKYLITLLNKTGKVYYTPSGVKLVGDPTITYLHKRGRKKKYTQELVSYLKAIWVLSHYRSSLHLKAFIENNQQWLLGDIKESDVEGFAKEERMDLGPLVDIPAHIKEQLVSISASTIERLLKPIKDQYKLKHRYRPHPQASVLKKRIPVEPHYNKPRGKVGYVELDTVHHSGGVYKGSCILSLGAPEIETAWTELRALRNKAMEWTNRALEDIKKTVPYEIHTIHPDNGTEVLNRVVEEFTEKYHIRYVRSRPYHKNDNPVVESRNFTLIRSYVGYRRYDTEAKFRILEELLPLISQLHNYFIPTMKLVQRERVGGKVHRVYEIDTPYNRILRSADVNEEKKQELRERKAGLSYLQLLQRILYLQRKLDQTHQKKYNPVPKDDEND